VVPELLPLVHVRDVHLDERGNQGGAGVTHSDRRVGPGAGVEHDRRGCVGRLVQPPEQLALVVGLAHLDREAEFVARLDAQRGQLGVGRVAVDHRLAAAETAEVRAVEYEHARLTHPLTSE